MLQFLNKEGAIVEAEMVSTCQCPTALLRLTAEITSRSYIPSPWSLEKAVESL